MRKIYFAFVFITLFGVDLDEVELLAVASKTGQSDSRNRKLRNDTPILLAGIASYPYVEYRDNQEKFKDWMQDNVSWLKEVYGDNLKNVTLHLDEEHPHIHFYATSPTGRVKDIHHGYKAESLVKNKSDSKSKKLAYIDAMQKFQNQYFLEVASKHGMLRIGPKKQRKSRSEHNADVANSKLLAQKIYEIDCIEKKALKSAEDKSNFMFNQVNAHIEKMLSHARKEIQTMQEEALLWARNALENIRKLTEAESKVKTLGAELKTTKEELTYFVEENKNLERRLLARNSKNSNNY